MNWFYEMGGQQQGPVGEEDLDRLLAEGKIALQTLVWHEGMSDWQPLQTARAGAGGSIAPSGPAVPGTVQCASCGRFQPASEVVQIGSRAICAACKPAVLQSLQQSGDLLPMNEADRNGPAWEQRAQIGLMPAIWETIKAALSDPGLTFSRMKREGGVNTPLGYFVILSVVGMVANNLFQGALGLYRGSTPFNAFGPGFPNAGFMQHIGWIPYVLTMIVLSPVLSVLSAFIGAGFLHVCLMICQGARRPFETTFRVYCYGYGSSAALMLIPFCGAFIAGIWGVVVICIGFSRAHEISTGRATMAVLTPLLLCCALFLVFAVVFGIAAVGARH